MRKRLHLVITFLFLAVLLFDVVVWGAVPGLADVGPAIERSAANEAPLATTYITLGTWLDGRLPAFERYGASVLTKALGEIFPRIAEAPPLAMDLIFSSRLNGTHAWLKTMYWGAPVLFVLALLMWVRKPKKVSLMGRR